MVTLSPTEQLVLSLLRDRVTTLLGAELVKLVLFGSRARGHGHEESDLDVLVLLRSPDLATDLATRRAIQDIAADLTLEYGIRVSPLIRDPSFQWGGHSRQRDLPRRDGAVTDESAAGLARARDALRAARVLADAGLYADSVSRAYYAALSAAAALLASVGLTAKTHDGVHTLLGQHFVRTGKLAPELARTLSRAGADRDDADYEPMAVFTEAIARADIDAAAQFIDAAVTPVPERKTRWGVPRPRALRTTSSRRRAGGRASGAAFFVEAQISMLE